MLPKNVHKVENIPTNATANAGSTSAEEFSDFSLEIAAISDIGNSREINQDSYATIHQAEQPMRALLVVADGMGGYEHGEVASKIAVETVVHDYELGSFLNHREAKPDETFSLIDQMIANQYPRCGTTCVAAVIDINVVRIANIGDSRAYMFRGESIIQITKDDSYVQDLVDMGRITPESARKHPSRNVLLKALGPGRGDKGLVYPRGFFDDDILLLCTDGLHGSVTKDEMIKVLRKETMLEEKCEELISLALKNGSTDNITVALAKKCCS